MRVAIISPLPPASTGIADYAVDVARALAPAHEVELFHDQPAVAPNLPGPARPIGELPARVAARGYDLIAYQMGNAPAHDFMYDWMPRVPGVVVLHDLVLHAFARRYLQSEAALAYAADPSSAVRRDAARSALGAYRDAVEAAHPGLADRLLDAHLNTTGDLLSYAYPMFEPALVHARAVAAHNGFMLDAVRAARPDLKGSLLVMPVEAQPVDSRVVTALRERFGIPRGSPVVGCFGLVTREKRIDSVARAVARLMPLHPDLRLLLAGPVADDVWLSDLLERAGIGSRTIVTGRLEANEFAAAMELADVVVQLRYPTARETSAAILRVMAQGRPLVVADIANQAEIPDDAVLRVDLADEEGGLARGLDRLLRDPAAARALGAAAARVAREHHSPDRARQSWEALAASVATDTTP